MSGPSSLRVAFDFAAASRRACRSKLPTAGNSRSMMYFFMTVLPCWLPRIVADRRQPVKCATFGGGLLRSSRHSRRLGLQVGETAAAGFGQHDQHDDHQSGGEGAEYRDRGTKRQALADKADQCREQRADRPSRVVAEALRRAAD